jgi:hypothetical protein
MTKLFDRLESVVFAAVNRIYGETIAVTWVASDNSTSFTGIVLFNNPTNKESMDQMEFMDADPYIEFLAPAFAGLKEFVDAHGSADPTEHVTINGDDYVVTEVQRLRDGNNFKAYLQVVNDGYGPKNQ